MSMSVVLPLTQESAVHADPLIPAWAVGALVLGTLIFLLVVLLMFGAGRDHS
jgi:hypothetical protein